MSLRKSFQLTRKFRFNWNMDKFKFSFLSRGELQSLSLDEIFLPLFKIKPGVFDNFIFAIIDRIFLWKSSWLYQPQ